VLLYLVKEESWEERKKVVKIGMNLKAVRVVLHCGETKKKEQRDLVNLSLHACNLNYFSQNSYSWLFLFFSLFPILAMPSKLFHPPTLHSSSSSSAPSTLSPNFSSILGQPLFRARTPPLVPTIHYGTEW